jgi:CheY-like chemotaxis protein
MTTLLIIDDNESVRESLKHVFMRRGYTVVVAAGGEPGLALHAKGGIDAALIDINMPGMNGVEACRLLHCQMETAARKIPVWLMTGAIGPDVEELGLAAGALAVLHKPFDILAFTRELDAQLATGVAGRERGDSSVRSA